MLARREIILATCSSPRSVPGITVDRKRIITSDEAIAWAHKLMKQEGILAGISSGAAMGVAHRLSQQKEHRGKMIVVILPDSGERYLTSALFAGSFSESETVQATVS